MITTGIRDLKNNLSRYIRQIEASGQSILVTDHGRVVAELGPPTGTTSPHLGRYEEMVASKVARPPIENGDPLADWPTIRLPKGTAAALIDADRDER